MYERFYPDSDGKIKFRGTFRDELAHGTHIWYALNGDIDSAKVFKNGTLVAAGDLTTDGLRVGEWREYYYPEGNVRAFGKYKEGFKVDYWEYYFQNGALEQKGKYGDKGLPTGEWTWYYESGAVQLTESFRAGKEHGIHIEYNDTGKVVSKGEFVNGLEEGEWFYEFGDHYEEGLYEEGMRQGIWKHYYLSNGRLRFEGSYFDDLPMNKHTWYYDTGVKMLEGSYVSGVQEGEWKRFNEDGSLFVTIEYNSGQEVKVDGLKLKVKGLDDQPSGE
jgi:antitoxin component YwqK of YwqJK toxin-antitoxin module